MPDWVSILLLYVLGYFLVKYKNRIEQECLLKEKKERARRKMFENGAGI